ncbi:MAG TPA: TraM recognition domain-containing protein [Candidatus Angelobacter sp.]|nr:TraM recognition domain-containing protein [Candidatus Angelobacter sp.]
MLKRPASAFTATVRSLVEHRLILALGLSVACGLVLASMLPINLEDPLLLLIKMKQPEIYLLLGWSYTAFLYSTPFLVISMALSFIYVHFYAPDLEHQPGPLPKYPDPRFRRDLFLVLGEVHNRLDAVPSPNPHWFQIPEHGLYTGINVIGATGSAKTQAFILPAMRQLFAYRSRDPERKLSGIVLEVKGDLCRQLRRILEWCGREQDYIEISLNGDIRYNPLNNDLDAYAQAYNIAAIITSIWGKGKEPFWQQSYTDLVRYVIILHRVRDGYVTLVDVFRTVISAGKLEEMLIETGRKFTSASFIGITKKDYSKHESMLKPFGFAWNTRLGQYLAPWTPNVESKIVTATRIAASLFKRCQGPQSAHERWESVHYWYWEHWKFFRSEVKTSIVQGIEIFLSLFETDPEVRRVFCPPKELYEGTRCDSDPIGRVLPAFDELIESGKIVGLNFPVALNPVLAKTIGTMMKIDYQRAVLLRIPKMDREPGRHFRPTVFVCDEYQNFATVGGDNPTGDERFLSISRQPRCIPIVATQSISSLKEAMPNQGVKTLLQAFRTKIFLATSDPDTARFASELCGKADRTRISYTVSESSTNANVGWLSGRTSSNKGSLSASKQYQKHKEPLFDEIVFTELKNAQSIVVAFDGITPLPATYCYLKPDFLPIWMTWFEQAEIRFDPRRIPA